MLYSKFTCKCLDDNDLWKKVGRKQTAKHDKPITVAYTSLMRIAEEETSKRMKGKVRVFQEHLEPLAVII